MSRTHLVSIGLCLLFIAAGIGVMKTLTSLKKDPPRQAQMDLDVIPVKILTIHPTTDRVVVKGFGTIQPRLSMALPTELAGRIAFRDQACEAGQHVASGQLLFSLDREPYELARTKAQTQVNQLSAQEAQLEEEIRGFRRSLEISSTSVHLAQKEFQRFSRLVEESATSKSQLEKTESLLQAALSSKTRDENSLAQGIARRGPIKAAIEQAQAVLAETELNLRRTMIRAPFEGLVEKRLIESGEYVTAGKTLVELYDPDSLEVRIPLAMADLPWIALPNLDYSIPAITPSTTESSGLKAEEQVVVTLCIPGSSEGQCSWQGKISRVAPSLSEKTRTLELIVSVSRTHTPNSTHFFPLIRGMFVEAGLVGRSLENVFRIPRAVISRENTIPLFIDGKLVLRHIETLRLDGDYAFVRGKLESGEQLVLTPIARAIEGMRLSIVPAAEKQ